LDIKVNGQHRQIGKNNVSVFDLLTAELVKNLDTVAVVVNGGFLKKEQFQITFLKNGDEVEFLYFMGGGGSQTR